MTQLQENIVPEAGNLYSALRNSGYSNIAAMGDLVDNSLDAGARTIKIDIASDLKQIFLSDDGSGMSPETLNQALKLGGRKAHDNVNDLGKYGLGLITASISMGTRLRVITRKDGVTSTGVFDVDEVCDSNKFTATFREADDSEIRSFDFRTDSAESGTVLSIENCDKIQYSNVKDFEAELRSYFKSAFWSFIKDGRKIIINGDDVPSEDPLYTFDGRTSVRLNKVVKVPMDNGGTEELEIVAVLIPDFGRKLNRSLRINIENQGFYVLRNNREIAPAVEIVDVYTKHNSLNRLRIKLNFGPGLDEEMGVNYTKHNISPNKKIVNILKRELGDTVKKVRKEVEGPKGGGETPVPEPPVNPFAGPQTPPTVEPTDGGSTGTGDEPESEVLEEVQVKTRFGNEKDSLLSVSTSGNSCSVWINGTNKYYKDNFVEKEGGSELKSYFDKVLKAFVEASVKNNVPIETIKKISEDVSSALEESE